MPLDDRETLAELESRLGAILPADYQACYEDLQPISMGSAGLKYSDDGKVAWNQMWATFCDLAMAGGPPHKGTLLEPATRADINAQSTQYELVVHEICRGITMVTDLAVQPFAAPGWVRLACHSEGMAGWLLRAIVMENVSVRVDGAMLDLPAGPHFRIDREIKNVITVIAKTTHYWSGHVWRPQQETIADLFVEMAGESPLIVPAGADEQTPEEIERVYRLVADGIHRTTGLPASSRRYAGWIGIECPSVHAAIWMMRTMVAVNVLSRREGTTLFVPINPVSDPTGEIVVDTVELMHRLADVKGVLV